jgi:hypothetical protein
MAGYRLYFLNEAGHIVDAADALHDTDNEAVAWAERQRDVRELELWSGARIVAKIPKRQHA